MGPLMLRSRVYYIKLISIWASFGVCVYLYHSSTWRPVNTGQNSFDVKEEEKQIVDNALESLSLSTKAADQSKSISFSSTLSSPSSSMTNAMSRISAWASRSVNEESGMEDSGGLVSLNANWNANSAEARDEDDGGFAKGDDANFNAHRPVPEMSQPTHRQVPSMAKDLQMYGGHVFRDDIFTRDISDLTQRELIYRFVKNKEEFLRRSEKSLPNYLRQRNLHWTLQDAGSYSPAVYSPPPNELPDQRLPQAIIIGAGKCGTRALLEFLSMHPLAVTPDPEIHYFDMEENFAKGLDWYRSQMPLSYSNQMTIEKTPSYIWSLRAVDEIYRMNKTIKLMMIIRDPVERIVSQASRGDNDDVERFFLDVDGDKNRIKTESRTVDWGIYVKYAKAWMAKFPPSQIHLLESKELIRNPALEIQKVERFLGLPPMITEDNFYYNVTKGFYCMRPFYPTAVKCLPEAKGKKHLQLKPLHEKMLYDFYRPYNEELFSLIGRRFTWMPKSRRLL